MNETENIIELSNVEIHEHCMLNFRTGKKIYNKGKKQIPYFTGQYFKDRETFFALYPTENGPVMYYQGMEYQLKKELHISLKKTENCREFIIEEYNIRIKYQTSKYIGFDIWSKEEDVDLFFQIEKLYKSDDYYKKFTKSCL